MSKAVARARPAGVGQDRDGVDDVDEASADIDHGSASWARSGVETEAEKERESSSVLFL